MYTFTFLFFLVHERFVVHMIQNTEWIGYALAVTVGTIGSYGLISQIALNIKNRFAGALSIYTMLLSNTIGTLKLFYMLLRGLPILLSIMLSIQLCLSYIITYQCYMYTADASIKSLIRFALSMLFTFVTVLFVVTRFIPVIFVGDVIGWITLLFGLFLKVPQIIHNYQRKTLKGYSYRYLISNLTISLVGLSSTLILQLPIQSVLLDLRLVLVYSIEIGQYYWYGTN